MEAKGGLNMEERITIDWLGASVIGCPYKKRRCAACPHDTGDEEDEWHRKRELEMI